MSEAKGSSNLSAWRMTGVAVLLAAAIGPAMLVGYFAAQQGGAGVAPKGLSFEEYSGGEPEALRALRGKEDHRLPWEGTAAPTKREGSSAEGSDGGQAERNSVRSEAGRGPDDRQDARGR